MSGNIDESFNSILNNDDSTNRIHDIQRNSLYDQYSNTKSAKKKLELSKTVSTSNECLHTRVQNERECYSTPIKPSKDNGISFSCYISDSDSSESEKYYLSEKKYIMKKTRLPPIGVFWDIENCRIPKGRSAVSVAQLIRDLFFKGYREAEFIVVCDVKKESNQALQELSDAQITLIHVASTCKNAADEKLRQAMRRFADTYSAPAAVILISGDVNFASDLSDLRHRKKIHVILIHLENTADALILCASEHYNYMNLTQTLPLKEVKTTVPEQMEVVVRNLPTGYDPVKLKQRLKQISDNCGGKVVFVSLETSTAVVRFTSLGVAIRAHRRMDGEDVYGQKISVSFPSSIRNWDKAYSPYRHSGRKVMRNLSQDMYTFNHPMYGVPPPNPGTHLPLEYYNGHPPPHNYMDSSNGTVPKTNQEGHNFNHIEPIKKTYQQLNGPISRQNSMEGIRYIPKPQHASGPIDFSNESWRQSNSSFSEIQNRNRTQTDISANKLSWPSNNMSGSFNALNMIGNEENELQFQGSNNITRSNSLSNSSTSSPVELLVTNIDQTMDPQELKRVLLSMFKEHVMVVSLSLFHQSDGNLAASVRVSSAQDAQYVISQLHRRKVGHKRVVISNAQSSSPNPHILRTQVISLLQEVPGNRMLLFKFRELLESRYRTSVSVSELYKLRDVCTVNDELGGRMVTLGQEYCTTPSRNFTMQMGIEVPHCVIHCPNGIGERGWAEPEMPALPNVRYQLKTFTQKVHALLNSHMGTLPLPSFAVCYEMEIGEKLCIDETGVPLEHLVTCVVGVDLRLGINMVKYLGWGCQAGNDEPNLEDGSNGTLNGSSNGPVKCVSPPLATQLALFSRELVDLLKTAPHCQLPFSRFIPAYHHHFGRQCRVADYGYTKLVDLFDALSHIVQVIGEGNKRFITLSHPAQIRRFTSDLLRVLKSQASKQVIMTEFAAAYERVLSRPFDPVDYGLCEIEDLLEDIPESTVVMRSIGNDVFIAIPKKEQTTDEIIRTKQFAVEVVDLLRHAPQYGMLFNKFVPAYHHHFGHQCRVSDYGFTKLIELFEAIPDVVKIEETSDGERRVSLIAKEALKVVCEQITALVKASRLQSIPLVALPSTFLREHGYALRPELYECESVDEIINQLSNSLQLVSSVAGSMVCILEESSQQQFGIRLWALLLTFPHSKPLAELFQDFQKKYGYSCNIHQIEKYQSIVQVEKNANGEVEVSLTPRYVVAARLYHLLFDAGGTIYLGNIDGWYQRKYGEILRPAEFGAASLNALLAQLSFIVTTKGRRHKRNVSLNMNITNYGIPLPAVIKYLPNEQASGEANNNTMQWPPPPAHTYLFNTEKTTVSPPKPDTPPTNGHHNVWEGSIWNTSPSFSNSLNLCIPLPPVQTPLFLDNFSSSLISPTKNLLPACEEHLRNAPDPSQLPMPNAELLNKAKASSPSRDSGISSTSITNSLEEPDSSTSFEMENKLTPTKKRRQMRLAAHFTYPLNLT